RGTVWATTHTPSSWPGCEDTPAAAPASPTSAWRTGVDNGACHVACARNASTGLKCVTIKGPWHQQPNRIPFSSPQLPRPIHSISGRQRLRPSLRRRGAAGGMFDVTVGDRGEDELRRSRGGGEGGSQAGSEDGRLEEGKEERLVSCKERHAMCVLLTWS
ncbi:hypothetical protein CYMTET_30782, partial [Cymbomonas tetramitiformis]